MSHCETSSRFIRSTRVDRTIKRAALIVLRYRDAHFTVDNEEPFNALTSIAEQITAMRWEHPHDC